ncbi:MAG: hypothetical protein Q8N33_13720, partial [Rhodocyclaceae bacterium]|nr:hypothetical protein [Rhodocyclaceae bacterium]
MKISVATLIASLMLVVVTAASAAPSKSARKAQATAAPPPPQEIYLRHSLSGTPLDALATLALQFNDHEAKLKAGGGRIILEDVQGISDKARLPHLALFDHDDAMSMFDTRPRFRQLHQVIAT